MPNVTQASVAAATAGNYCKMVHDLETLTRETVQPVWYMVSAVEDHERLHVSDYKTAYNKSFAIAKATIEGLTVDPTCSMTADQAKEAIFNKPAFLNAQLKAAQDADAEYVAKGEPDPQPAYEAIEHAAVDPMVTSIKQHAAQNNWPACP